MKSKLILLAFTFSFGGLFANFENIKIEDYSYKDGLTTSGVNNVFKDSKGFIWLCSNNGLFRYDGYTFRNINTLVAGNFSMETYCITEDTDHNFLIGTNNGLFFYNSHLEKMFPVKINLGNKFKINQIFLLQKKIWIASDMGLISVSQQAFHPDKVIQGRLLFPDSLHRRTPQDNIINNMLYLQGKNSLWVGTNGALYELNLETLTFQLINSFFQNSIRGISEYHQQIIAASWDGGIFLVNPFNHQIENNSFIQQVNSIVGDKRVMSAIVDDQDYLWVATYGNGLYIFENKGKEGLSFVNYRKNQLHDENLKSDFINKMVLDNSGIIWLSMNQPALSKIYFEKSNLTYFNFPNYNNKNYQREILAVNQSIDKDKLWIATNGGGIYLFDTKKYSFIQFSDNVNNSLRLQYNDVNLCYQDKTGNLWIVYRKYGLFVVPSAVTKELLAGNLKTVIKPIDANNLGTNDSRLNSYITCFFEDSSGRLWLGGWGSLYILELKPDVLESNTTCVYTEERKEDFNYPISPVFSILEMKKNKYWLGTLGSGIIEMNEVSRLKFEGKPLPVNKKFPSLNTRSLYKDSRNNVWIATNSGLCSLNLSNDSLHLINSKTGLSSDNINSIIEDHHSNIWVSTSYGISEIKSNDESINNYYYTEDEFLNQYIPNAVVLTHEGFIYFSTNEALVLVNPNSTKANRKATPLYFTDIKIDNETIIPLEKYFGTTVIHADINECNTINVPFNHTLGIEFAALDYINPGRFLYKYRIEEENEWVLLNSNQRSLVIPNLKHGEYTLNIRLANSPDENNERCININYLPPFWLTKMAYVIYSLLLLTLFLIYRRLLIQKVLQKSIIEKERFERKKVEELDKMKNEFFSNISHEFRTPLSLIINPLEKLIKEKEITDKNKEKVKLILKSSNRLLKLTNELMDFSKIERRLLVPDFQFCEMVSFVDDLIRPFNNLADTMNIDFKTNYSFDRLEIPVDKGMIEKVIFNLLSNAFKYTPENGMIMLNLAKSSEAEKEYVKISVINTGEGIDEENLTKIFDRYYQVNNLQNRNIEGTGIGLAMVKSFVELHNGKINVKSERHVETSFDVYLPVVQENYNSTELVSKNNYNSLNNVAVNQGYKNQTLEPGIQYRLLIIEDDDDVRNFIIGELSSEFKVLSAKNGEDGLNIANKVIPDLIITDVVMPLLSGLELCRKLKNQIITSHIPILILSAKVNVDNQIEGLEMGADVYMVKPFHIDHLKAQIFRLITLKQAIYTRYIKETALVPNGTLSNKLDEEFMKKVMTFIEENLTNYYLNVEQLANCVSLSKVQTYRKIKAISGLSIVEFIRTIRLKKAAQKILEGRLNFSEIAYETGFSTPSYFSKCFHDHFGMTPSEYVTSNVKME